MTTKQTSEEIQPCFETQDIHHQKSKSVVPQEGLISHNKIPQIALGSNYTKMEEDRIKSNGESNIEVEVETIGQN